MFEIDQKFYSLEEWIAWATSNPYVFRADHAKRMVDQIADAGLVEPLTGWRMSAHEIQVGGTNVREGLVAHGINARMRSVLALIDEKFGHRPRHDVRIFATEAVTAFALRLRGLFPRFLGSEYALNEEARRALFPIQHEDLTALSLPSESFDLVTTNEVLEHIPDLDAGLREIARVLKPGGWHVGTHPFRFMSEEGDLRARIVDGAIVHIKEPERHGNPVDPGGGSLVFETPGWDILQRARSAGFSDAHMRFVASVTHGFLTENTGVFVLCAQR
ncbi:MULTISPECIES: class I SAM-dependent methyltransferase [Methylobacterium]|uniref:class I SAM-dependent methyltransferase n=1 Tax=Methylobacterium TaxID=407 RepID=UPI0010462E95|nr:MULTISPECIES: class I SAM-dependent methyltransferase [Methylobacterium]MDR7036507.1 SAM-dependent methyltransferase [Methylobacterium sp. BE186]